MDDKLKEMIEAHWAYVREVLNRAGEDRGVIEKIGFHYKTAMEHGWKHAMAAGGNHNKHREG